MVKEVSPSAAAKSKEIQSVVPVDDLLCWIPLWNPVPRRRKFMSHVGVSPKLSGGSTRFLLPLAGSWAVGVFGSARTQTFAACCFFLSCKKAHSKQSIKSFRRLGSQTVQTIGFAWCFSVSSTTDVKRPWSQASADLMLRPSDRERVKTSPPRIHSTDPAQPMKRAAPSSNLFTKGLRWGARGVCLSSYFNFLSFFCWFFYSKNLLLCNEERVEEVGRDSVSVNGARSHATQACNQKMYSNLRIWNLNVHP